MPDDNFLYELNVAIFGIGAFNLIANHFWETFFSDTKKSISDSTHKSMFHYLIRFNIYLIIAIIVPLFTKRPGSIKATFGTLVLVGVGLFAAWFYKINVEMDAEDG